MDKLFDNFKSFIVIFAPIIVINFINVLATFVAIIFVGDPSNDIWALAVILFITNLSSSLIFNFWCKKLTVTYYKDGFLTIKNFTKSFIWIWIIILGISSQFIVSNAITLLVPVFEETFNEYFKLTESVLGNSSPWLLILTIYIVAPIAEEFAFRGLTLKYAKKICPTWIAIIIQATLFSFFHTNIVQQVYAFIFGIILGIIATYFRSIIPAILFHISINMSTALVPLISTNDVKKTTILLIVSIVVFVVSFISVVVLNKHKPII